MSFPLLTVLVFSPLLGALLATLMGLRGNIRLVKQVSIIYSLVPLALSLALWAELPQHPIGITTAEIDVPWIPLLNSHYHMGADGISIVLVVLTTVLTTVSLIFAQRLSDTERSDRTWQFYMMFFLLEVGMLGVFVSLDLVLFFLFWEVSLIPMYFIILLWGGTQREGAALKFILYTLVGSAGMLIAFAALFLNGRTTDIVGLIALAQRHPIFPGMLGAVVFWLLFFGFAIKVPVFPFHTWLPLAHTEAPTEGSVILAAILLKMGVYGMIRICLQILPDQFHAFSAVVAWLGAISVIYGALCAMAQTDLKKLVAYSSINHMGFCILGLGAAAGAAGVTAADLAGRAAAAHVPVASLLAAYEGFRTTALNGAVIEMVAHGLITGAMFMLVGVIYDRAHHRDLRRFGGLWSVMPLYGGVMIFCTMASLGLPTLIGFVGEFLAFLGAFPIYQTAAVVSAFGLILAAAYWLWMLQRLLYGPTNPDYVGLPDMAGREKLAIFPLMAIILVLGLWPRLILDMINTADVNLFTDQRSILSRRFSPSPLSMRVSQAGFQRPHKTTT